MKDGVQMIVDGLPEEDIRNIMETRVVNRELREDAEANVFKTMGVFSPAFGMVGTLVGLVAMLFNLKHDDPINNHVLSDVPFINT